ncbi:MmgE/PrpD family protein [Methylobacterium sp. J-070]|uniref:MmgE/PrpD family protein n=1 Tax=Methylobacterium sp. J-070 TaxID=2836650 RepID=UPI001FBADB02|nr:MmgE/PrpD family protein [Methylobacterium sp. J-070]MCJ2048942.1 MmgE/PrpD family protein [Methylobacterium sp. J-070]
MSDRSPETRDPEAATAVQRIAAFAQGASPAALTPEVRRTFKRNILDSIGCAIAAVPGRPFAALRDQFAEYRANGGCTLIGGGQTSPDQAALYNSSLVRYVDLLDSYMSPGGLCHPSDNFGVVLAAAEHAKASGEEFLLALAVAYEIQCRITAVVPVMAKGFNHAIQLAVSAAAACGKLFGLTTEEIAHAIAIATIDNVSLTCVHAEPVSQWKGFSPGMTGMRAIYAASLAKRGFTGPSNLFEGPNGLERMFAQDIPVDWADPSLEVVLQTVMKKYCSLIHGQPVLEATLALRRSYDLGASDVESVVCDTFQTGYDIAGGGAFGSKDTPRTKEQADYNMKYLIAAALLDGQVGPAQLEEARVRADDAQDLLSRVTVRPDRSFTERYPLELNARITIRTRDGRTLEREQRGYEGGLDDPLSWDRTVEKFNWLSEPFADESLRWRIVRAVEDLETGSVRDLMALLAEVRAKATYPARHPGIQ